MFRLKGAEKRRNGGRRDRKGRLAWRLDWKSAVPVPSREALIIDSERRFITIAIPGYEPMRVNASIEYARQKDADLTEWYELGRPACVALVACRSPYGGERVKAVAFCLPCDIVQGVGTISTLYRRQAQLHFPGGRVLFSLSQVSGGEYELPPEGFENPAKVFGDLGMGVGSQLLFGAIPSSHKGNGQRLFRAYSLAPFLHPSRPIPVFPPLPPPPPPAFFAKDGWHDVREESQWYPEEVWGESGPVVQSPGAVFQYESTGHLPPDSTFPNCPRFLAAASHPDYLHNIPPHYPHIHHPLYADTGLPPSLSPYHHQPLLYPLQAETALASATPSPLFLQPFFYPALPYYYQAQTQP